MKNGTMDQDGLVATEQALLEMVGRVVPHTTVAIDTEADSLHCYFEKLCLVQIGLPSENALIDPLVGVSLQPLMEVLRGRRIVVHGADFDLRILRRNGGFTASEIFDTVIAARLTGSTDFGLAALVQSHFGVTLRKGSQKADWGKRPLSQEMMEYARNDTRFLLPLAEKLEALLLEKDRWEWFRQSCEKAIAQAGVTRDKDTANVWRVRGSFDLSPRAGAILRELWWWRDQEARDRDRPPFQILRNEDLIESAVKFDAGQKPILRHLRGSRRQRFMAAAEKALALPESDYPQWTSKGRARLTPQQERHVEQLRAIRDGAAGRLGLDPSIIAPRATLEKLAVETVPPSEMLLPWQRELLNLC